LVWDFADIPLSQTEDIGVPRIYFCEPAAAVYAVASSSSQSSSSNRNVPHPTFIMVTYHQVVVFENNIQEKKRSLVCTVELNDYKNTRVQRVVKDDGRDTSFAFVSFSSGSGNKKSGGGVLISFLDVVTRNFFIQVCDQVGRLHCNDRCCLDQYLLKMHLMQS